MCGVLQWLRVPGLSSCSTHNLRGLSVPRASPLQCLCLPNLLMCLLGHLLPVWHCWG